MHSQNFLPFKTYTPEKSYWAIFENLAMHFCFSNYFVSCWMRSRDDNLYHKWGSRRGLIRMGSCEQEIFFEETGIMIKVFSVTLGMKTKITSNRDPWKWGRKSLHIRIEDGEGRGDEERESTPRPRPIDIPDKERGYNIVLNI